MTKSNYDKAVELTHKLIESITDKEELEPSDKGKMEMLKALAAILPKLSALKKKKKKRVVLFDRKKDEENFNKFIERKVAERLAEKANETTI